MAILLLVFENFPKERELVGKILVAYGELEFAILGCISAVLSDDLDTSARILFRVRGETARLEVSDAIIRPALAKVGLLGKWGNAIGAARTCKNIRNQYAHCHWTEENNKELYFIDLDSDAKSPPESNSSILQKRIDAALLQRQFEYFEYALTWLYHLESEYLTRIGKKPSQILPEPKSVSAPPLYNRQSLDAPPP
ncbi:MAG: hypothetical protein WCA28_17300 [Bradyrhizobium sp.]